MVVVLDKIKFKIVRWLKPNNQLGVYSSEDCLKCFDLMRNVLVHVFYVVDTAGVIVVLLFVFRT